MIEDPPAALPSPPSWAGELTTVGVTGTNGKTTTTLLVGAALEAAASPVALATTLGSYLGGEKLEVTHDYRGFLATMAACRRRKGRYAAIELTSEALARGFARAWPCQVGIFTNLSRDHLDAHGSPEHYLASKAQLFMQLSPGGAAILNAADPASELLAEVVPAGVRRVSYGLPSRGRCGAADLRAKDVRLDWERGTTIVTEGIVEITLRIRGLGHHFAENALAALAGAMAVGIEPETAAAHLSEAPVPEGRFEVVSSEPWVVVDYAHTPDALERTIATARALSAGQVVVVFGAGGERDQAKRLHMGRAARAADRVILTSDNPRSEDPAAIAAQIARGLEAAPDIELDRRRALELAIGEAGAGDVVLIAGKGHERTQQIGGVDHPFSDAEVARTIARRRARRSTSSPR